MIGSLTENLPTGLRFGTSIELIKRASGSYVDGLYQEGAQEVTLLTANVQPGSQDDRQNVPSGERITEVIAVFIKSRDRNLIRPARQGVNNSRGDVIRINNLDYEVSSVNNYSLNGHIKAVCYRRENQND